MKPMKRNLNELSKQLSKSVKSHAKSALTLGKESKKLTKASQSHSKQVNKLKRMSKEAEAVSYDHLYTFLEKRAGLPIPGRSATAQTIGGGLLGGYLGGARIDPNDPDAVKKKKRARLLGAGFGALGGYTARHLGNMAEMKKILKDDAVFIREVGGNIEDIEAVRKTRSGKQLLDGMKGKDHVVGGTATYKPIRQKINKVHRGEESYDNKVYSQRLADLKNEQVDIHLAGNLSKSKKENTKELLKQVEEGRKAFRNRAIGGGIGLTGMAGVTALNQSDNKKNKGV